MVRSNKKYHFSVAQIRIFFPPTVVAGGGGGGGGGGRGGIKTFTVLLQLSS